MKKLLNNRLNLEICLAGNFNIIRIYDFYSDFVQVSDPPLPQAISGCRCFSFKHAAGAFVHGFLYFATTNNICVSYSVTAAVLFALLTVNHYKIYFRDDPLNPNDMLLYKEVGNIVQNYQLTLSRHFDCGICIYCPCQYLRDFSSIQ